MCHPWLTVNCNSTSASSISLSSCCSSSSLPDTDSGWNCCVIYPWALSTPVHGVWHRIGAHQIFVERLSGRTQERPQDGNDHLGFCTGEQRREGPPAHLSQVGFCKNRVPLPPLGPKKRQIDSSDALQGFQSLHQQADKPRHRGWASLP